MATVVLNADRLRRKLSNLPAAAQKRVSNALLLGAVAIHGTAVETLQGGSRTGRIYRRRGIVHQASAPGEPPKTDTGQLVGSLFFENRGPLAAAVGTRLDYGLFLEMGTTTMASRPWLKPSFLKNRGEIEKRVRAAIMLAIKESK